MSVFIGVTGTTGAGKSTVVRELLKYGAVVLNADIAAREALLPESPVTSRVIEALGHEIELFPGIIDRKALGKVVFQDPEKLRILNEITHPYIREQMLDSANNALRIYRDRSVVVFDAPLLIESGMKDDMDEIWLVTASPEIRSERIKKRDRLTDVEAKNRISARVPEDELKKHADVIIENNGDMKTLIKTVETLFKERTKKDS